MREFFYSTHESESERQNVGDSRIMQGELVGRQRPVTLYTKRILSENLNLTQITSQKCL